MANILRSIKVKSTDIIQKLHLLSQKVFLENTKHIKNELKVDKLYVNRNQTKYFEDFLNSDRKFFFIAGAPGVGKTFFSYYLASTALRKGNFVKFLSAKDIMFRKKESALPFKLGIQNINYFSLKNKLLLFIDGIHEANSWEDINELISNFLERTKNVNSKIILNCRTSVSDYFLYNLNRLLSERSIYFLELEEFNQIELNHAISKYLTYFEKADYKHIRQISKKDILSYPIYLRFIFEMSENDFYPTYSNKYDVLKSYWSFMENSLEKEGIRKSILIDACRELRNKMNLTVSVKRKVMDEAIMAYIKRRYNLIIGERIAEQIKIDIISAALDKKPRTINIKGRDLISGISKTIHINEKEIRDNLIETVSIINNFQELSNSNLSNSYALLYCDIGKEGDYSCSFLHNIIAEYGIAKSIIEDYKWDKKSPKTISEEFSKFLNTADRYKNLGDIVKYLFMLLMELKSGLHLSRNR